MKRNSKKPAGIKGLTERYDPHMHGVARLCEESWAVVRDEKIVHCCIKAKILPEVFNTDLRNKFG